LGQISINLLKNLNLLSQKAGLKVRLADFIDFDDQIS
jgi:hypothetical protein